MLRTSTAESSSTRGVACMEATETVMSASLLFRAQHTDLECLQCCQRQGRDQDDRDHGGIHFRIVGYGAMIGDEVTDAGRCDQEFGQDDTDEPGGEAETQSGKDHRARIRDNDLGDLLESRTLERTAHCHQGWVGVPDRLVAIQYDD